ncbi:MAG: SAM-dependent methyltransferase [Williamsia sp.]|nr:SAM-dependent methyltransferase [Williamsia sp.]
MSTSKELSIQSAHTVSVLRAIAVKEKDPAVRGSDYLARHFLTPKYSLFVGLLPHRFLKSFVHFRAPGSYCFMITRTRHFDRVLLEEIEAGAKQVVVLGAGYDTRAFRFAAQLQNTAVFEVDFPGTQLYKKERIRETDSRLSSPVTYIPVDFNEQSFDKALIRNGFSPRLKTLFLWEGVSYYLPQPVVEQVLQFVSSCAPGSSILFDYCIKSFVNGDHSTYGGRQLASWLKKIKEPFLFGIDPDETAGFLHNCHLELVSDHGPEDFERMYLKTSKGGLYGKTFGHIRMAHARKV